MVSRGCMVTVITIVADTLSLALTGIGSAVMRIDTTIATNGLTEKPQYLHFHYKLPLVFNQALFAIHDA